jgi:hypothetical protein
VSFALCCAFRAPTVPDRCPPSLEGAVACHLTCADARARVVVLESARFEKTRAERIFNVRGTRSFVRSHEEEDE